MRFVAGSHRRHLVPHRDFPSEKNLLSRGQENRGRGRRERGDRHCAGVGPVFASNHGLMFHSSGPNRSKERRVGVAIRYVNPNARQVDGSKEHALLVRGVDRRQNFIHFAPPRYGFGLSEIALHEEIMRSKTAADY